MKGRLYINGKDAWETWGIVADDSAISALLTPSANKNYVQSESRLENGVRLHTGNIKMAARDFSFNFSILAQTREDFFDRYADLCKIFAEGKIDIKTDYLPGTVFRCFYKKCSQFTQFNGKAGKFTLSLIEPNPTDRGELKTNGDNV